MRKICKNCKIFVKEDICPICRKNSFSTNWKGRIFFINTEKSVIAKNMDVTKEGEYALKVK